MPKKTRKLVRKMYQSDSGTIHRIKEDPWTDPVFVIRQADVPEWMEGVENNYANSGATLSDCLKHSGLVPPPAKKGGRK